MNPAPADLIAAARMAVVTKHPYLSCALFALRPHPAPGLGTLAVDAGWRLFYDPATVLAWHAEEQAGLLDRVAGRRVAGHDGVAAVVFHELGHVLRQHHARRQERDPQAWNWAGDREINDDVAAAGWRLPGEGLMPGDLGMADGLTAEEYYQEDRRQGGHVFAVSGPGRARPGSGGPCGGAAGNPTRWEQDNATSGGPGGSPSGGGAGAQAPAPCDPLEQAIVLNKTAQDVANYAKSHGKGSVPSGLQAWAEARLEPPKVDWRRQLAGLVRGALAATAGASDWTWRRTGRRALHAGGRPGWPLAPAYTQPVPRVAVVLDTSGSMQFGAHGERTAEDLALSEVVGIARAAGADVWAVPCDAAAYTPVRVTGPRDVEKLNQGGGGTDLRPGFSAARSLRPDVVVLVTDGLVGNDWPDADACHGLRVLACVVGDRGAEAPPWIPTVVAQDGDRHARL